MDVILQTLLDIPILGAIVGGILLIACIIIFINDKPED